jgi:hypothetical protein
VVCQPEPGRTVPSFLTWGLRPGLHSFAASRLPHIRFPSIVLES